MRATKDLMERLAAADPLPEAERLTPDEQRDADELLARLTATPVSPHPRPALRPSGRRWTLVAAGIAGAAIAAFAAAILLDSDAPGPSVVELAVAAVSRDDAVYHSVERTRMIGRGFGDRTYYTESWHTTAGRHHQRMYAARGGRRGRQLFDQAGRRTPGRRGGPALVWESRRNKIQGMRVGWSDRSRGAPALDPFADPAAALRAFEAQGRLRLAGRTTVDGTPAYRLVSGYVDGFFRGTKERIVYVVDAETYLPLAVRDSHRRNGRRLLEVTIRYLVYERLPLNDRTRAKLALDPHPGAKCARGADKILGGGSLGFPNPCAR
jgi:hypothetical protein